MSTTGADGTPRAPSGASAADARGTTSLTGVAIEQRRPEEQARIRVVVSEDSYLIRDILVTTLNGTPEVELIAVCSDANGLQTALSRWHPDVVVTDFRGLASGAAEGIRVAGALHDSSPEVGVVVLSQYVEPAYALAFLDCAIERRAYLIKERIGNRQELITAIKTVAAGGTIIDPLVVDVLVKAKARNAHSRVSQLTGRERQLVAEIAAGKSNAAIAESLALTQCTVEEDLHSIFAKLRLSETEDASRRANTTLMFLANERGYAL